MRTIAILELAAIVLAVVTVTSCEPAPTWRVASVEIQDEVRFQEAREYIAAHKQESGK